MDRFATVRGRLRHGTAGAADTRTGAAPGSLSGMEVRRRSSSLQTVTIQ